MFTKASIAVFPILNTQPVGNTFPDEPIFKIANFSSFTIR